MSANIVYKCYESVSEVCKYFFEETDVEEPVIESENEENDDEISLEMDEISSTGSDSEGDVFHYSMPRIEVDLDAEYADIIEKVRKLVKPFKRSPTKNDTL
ncbi:hypothetical protein EVAR_9938_1 [Eumeta japonica]|uniref:Uncharacterized protein n=1 Tax=Eumeta variegata TaxID=151549 RepID=A0A4C1TQT4_EUMVA|nr:hypothetical protein EVAR_9938_1 [Eumeta japonica]